MYFGLNYNVYVNIRDCFILRSCFVRNTFHLRPRSSTVMFKLLLKNIERTRHSEREKVKRNYEWLWKIRQEKQGTAFTSRETAGEVLKRQKTVPLVISEKYICSTRETCIEWLKNKGFIPRIMFCPNCSRKMKFESDEYAIDGYIWSCKECTFNPSQFSTRHGSWLEGIDAPLVDILLFTYLWASGFSELEISREVNMPLNTVQEWNVMYLNICSSIYRRNMPAEDQGDANVLDISNQEECAVLWRKKKKYADPFVEFLKDADSL